MAQSDNLKQHIPLLIFVTVSLTGLVILLVKSQLAFTPKTTKDSSTNMTETTIRTPTAAGRFYSGDSNQLFQDIEGFINQAVPHIPEELKQQSPSIIIVPHAGVMYSGEVAAAAIKQLDSSLVKRVFLLGSSHQEHLSQAALPTHNKWQTPLGTVELDQDLIQRLASEPNWNLNNSVHGPEHSLEVELPFLQKQLEDFTIVPILVGFLDEAAIEKTAADIAANFQKGDVLIISSDLSHYPPSELAEQADQEIIQTILDQDLNSFKQIAKEAEPDKNLQTRICGEQAVEVGLKIAEKLNLNQAHLYQYTHSGKITGDLTQVVGYASIGFYGDVDYQKSVQAAEKTETAKKLDTAEKTEEKQANSDFGQEAVVLARRAVEAYVNQKEPSKPENLHPRLLEKLGVFVTLNKGEVLRGCMGLIEAEKPLWEGIAQMAQAAALRDPRFPAVTPAELDQLEVEVSVLTQPVLVDSPKKVEAGRHGVIIEHGSRRGVFLPQVAQDQGYDREQFLNNLCSHKLGLDANCWQDPEADIYVFEAEVYHE